MNLRQNVVVVWEQRIAVVGVLEQFRNPEESQHLLLETASGRLTKILQTKETTCIFQ
jgi:hypothetical protein